MEDAEDRKVDAFVNWWLLRRYRVRMDRRVWHSTMPDETPIDHRPVADEVTAMASKVVLGRADLGSETSPQLLEVVALASAIYEAARVGLDDSVRHARQRGCTWTEIGQALGVTRQAAFRRFGRATSRQQ